MHYTITQETVNLLQERIAQLKPALKGDYSAIRTLNELEHYLDSGLHKTPFPPFDHIRETPADYNTQILIPLGNHLAAHGMTLGAAVGTLDDPSHTSTTFTSPDAGSTLTLAAEQLANRLKGRKGILESFDPNNTWNHSAIEVTLKSFNSEIIVTIDGYDTNCNPGDLIVDLTGEAIREAAVEQYGTPELEFREPNGDITLVDFDLISDREILGMVVEARVVKHQPGGSKQQD
ncbi:hypothetical protein [Deinococcus misasensis]|uniref:hypothetical protein n=1 Tax=Deinococcus misasensis TaxID=392413 RepID=UPI000551C761|nr:hypothetical protein [Deinococcus misasensis]